MVRKKRIEIKKNRNKQKKPYVVSFFVFDMTRTKRNSFTINAVGTSGGGKGARVQGCKGARGQLYFFRSFFYLFLLQSLKAVCQWFPELFFGRC